MKKIKIGIPRALLYHRYGILWKKFFESLNCKVVLSKETDFDILNLGIINSIKEYCLSYKIYLGHVLYLKDRCDYILIPNIYNYGCHNKVCHYFEELYDVMKQYIAKNEIINYQINYLNCHYEFFEFLKMGYKVSKNPIKIIYSYIIAKKSQKYHDINKEQEEKNKLYKTTKKVLLVSYSYNANDKLISKEIIDYLNNNDITIIYANRLNKKLAAAFSDYFMDDLEQTYSKEIIGSIYYYRYQIDGIIYISTNNCNIDVIMNNLAILKNKYLKTLNIVIDESISNKFIKCKLDNFINQIKENQND